MSNTAIKIKKKSGILQCKKCNGQAELYGIKEDSYFKYSCIKCYTLFDNEYFYEGSFALLIKQNKRRYFYEKPNS